LKKDNLRFAVHPLVNKIGIYSILSNRSLQSITDVSPSPSKVVA
jgi:hypothetical protein